MNKKQFGKLGGVPVLMAVFDRFGSARESDEVMEMALEALHRLCDHGTTTDRMLLSLRFFLVPDFLAVNRKRLLAHSVKPLLDLLTKTSRKRDIVLLLLKIFSLLANGGMLIIILCIMCYVIFIVAVIVVVVVVVCCLPVSSHRVVSSFPSPLTC
jgi:hypothetical protein